MIEPQCFCHNASLSEYHRQYCSYCFIFWSVCSRIKVPLSSSSVLHSNTEERCCAVLHSSFPSAERFCFGLNGAKGWKWHVYDKLFHSARWNISLHPIHQFLALLCALKFWNNVEHGESNLTKKKVLTQCWLIRFFLKKFQPSSHSSANGVCSVVTEMGLFSTLQSPFTDEKMWLKAPEEKQYVLKLRSKIVITLSHCVELYTYQFIDIELQKCFSD